LFSIEVFENGKGRLSVQGSHQMESGDGGCTQPYIRKQTKQNNEQICC